MFVKKLTYTLHAKDHLTVLPWCFRTCSRHPITLPTAAAQDLPLKLIVMNRDCAGSVNKVVTALGNCTQACEILPCQVFHLGPGTIMVPALFSPAVITMQQFMWQRDIVGVAHNIMGCLQVLGALGDAPDDASTSSPLALAAGQM